MMKYGQSQCKKEVGVKPILGIAAVATLGLSLWFSRQHHGTYQGAMLKPVVHITEGNNVAPQPPQDTGSLLVKPNLPLTESAPTREVPYVGPGLPNLTYAAKLATAAVVYVKCQQNAKIVKRQPSSLDQLFKDFFGDSFNLPREYEKPEVSAFGSGVICRSDGYIITNYHVVEGADTIEVTLDDHRCYEAKLVGSDPGTDLALLKIEEANLPFLKLGDSDKLEVGEWVLAVGHPFNLTATVTKGIVSAKSRGGLRDLRSDEGGSQLQLQSFIQTDAAMNQGNSGGALVNVYGELVGINAAICTAGARTAFMGYGFAIPVSMVKKVVGDLVQYGKVQRVLLGVTVRDVDDILARSLKLTKAGLMKKLGLKRMGGVYVNTVTPNSPCAKLLLEEDVIVAVNGRQIDTTAQLQEIVACAKPGDKFTITICRKGKERNVEVILEKEPGTLQVVQKSDALESEGAVFQNLDDKTKEKFKLSAGVWVKEVAKGKFQAARLKKGYILLALDKEPVYNITVLARLLRNTTKYASLEVMDPSTGVVYPLLVDFSSNASPR